MAEIIARPDFLEGALVYDALRAIAKAANDDEAAQRRQLVEYREYIETWVHEAKSPLAAAHLMLENLEDDARGAIDYDRLTAVGDELRRVEGYIEQALFSRAPRRSTAITSSASTTLKSWSTPRSRQMRRRSSLRM